MDLPKFVSMLEAQALHFARVDIMEDVFEGSIGKASLEHRRNHLYGDMPDDVFEDFYAQMSGAEKKILREYTYLSCWHMSEHESVAMWRIYQSGSPQGIAIRSTYRKLVESITDTRSVDAGSKVQYINFDTDIIPPWNVLYPIVHKRQPYDSGNTRSVQFTLQTGRSQTTPSGAGDFGRPSKVM